MLGKALRVSATVARGCGERVARRSGYGAQERVEFSLVLLVRLCLHAAPHPRLRRAHYRKGVGKGSVLGIVNSAFHFRNNPLRHRYSRLFT